MQDRSAPPAVYQGTPGRLGAVIAALDAAVVETVRVAVPAGKPVILTGLVDPKLKVGGYWAPAGLDVMVAVSVTLPVKPPDGVTVMVDVFPVVAPGATETVVPVMLKPAGIAELMVTEKLAVAESDAESVTLTVKLALPAADGVPDNKPPLERLKLIAARLPDVTDQVYGAPVPPVAANCCE
jgi:hypothetical protein